VKLKIKRFDNLNPERSSAPTFIRITYSSYPLFHSLASLRHICRLTNSNAVTKVTGVTVRGIRTAVLQDHERLYILPRMSAPVPRKCPLLLLLIPAFLLCVLVSAIEVDAQRTRGNTAKATTGTLKLKVPSGITGDNYWIYVNGKLRSSPPRGTPGPLPVMVVSVPYGSSKWEAWNSEGFVTSSARLDEYIKSGDKHGLFRDLEFQLPPGSHSVAGRDGCSRETKLRRLDELWLKVPIEFRKRRYGRILCERFSESR